MKKILVGLGVLVVILAVVLIVGKTQVGDLRPAVLPAPNNDSNRVPQPSPNANNASGKTKGETVSFLNVPSGYRIAYFAKNVPGARDLEWSPGGSLVVSETGSGKVVALPDTNGDGVADDVKVVLSGLKNPHGLAFLRMEANKNNYYLFVAEENRVVRYLWNEATFTATFDKKLFDLPNGGGHFTRSLLFTEDGHLLVSVGSSCNVCLEKDSFRAAIIISDANGVNPRIFAKGLRNSVFMTLNPKTKEVWATDMGRDFLGDNLPPDEINIIKESGDYGWPKCYGKNIHDEKFDQANYDFAPGYKRDVCGALRMMPSLFDIPAHSAPLGLAFWDDDLFVTYHGSWNRSVPTGYKVVRMKVLGNQVTGVEDLITGFLQGSSAFGRPVDVIFDSSGHLYISDDKAGVVYLLGRKG